MCREKKSTENSAEANNYGDVFKKLLQEHVAVTPENNEPCKRKQKRSSLGLNQSRKKNEKYVNTLMKENPEKYAQVYGHNSERNEGNEEKRRRRKRKKCAESTSRDNDKSTQVYLCCGKEVNSGEQYCQICSTKRVHVVESSTQADFVDIDGYVDEHLQKQLLEFTLEKSNTWLEM